MMMIDYDIVHISLCLWWYDDDDMIVVWSVYDDDSTQYSLQYGMTV